MAYTEVACVDCLTVFRVTTEQSRWAKERGFTPLKRCLACRNRRRKNKPETGAPPRPVGSPTRNH
jgi:hypothetical protein